MDMDHPNCEAKNLVVVKTLGSVLINRVGLGIGRPGILFLRGLGLL